MNNYLRLFLSTQGVINRRTFWHGIIVITALNMTLLGVGFWLQAGSWKSPHPPGPVSLNGKFQFSEVAPLLTVWFTICVVVKRLRAFHASYWVQLPSRILIAWGLSAVSISTLLSSSTHPLLETIIGLGAAGLLVGILIDLALITWLGFANPKGEQPAASE